MFIQVTPYLCTELDFIKTLEFTGQKNIITLGDNSKHEVNDKIAKEIYNLKKGKKQNE